MKTTIAIKFEDLSREKQDSLVQTVKTLLKDGYKAEGEKFLARKWHDPKPKNYKEAVVRMYAYEYTLWNKYEQFGGEMPDYNPDFDELYSDFLEQQVNEKLSGAMARTEIEVEL